MHPYILTLDKIIDHRIKLIIDHVEKLFDELGFSNTLRGSFVCKVH